MPSSNAFARSFRRPESRKGRGVSFARAVGFACIVCAVPVDALAYCRMSTVPNECCNEDDGSCTNLSWRRRCTSYGVDIGGSESIDMEDIRRIAQLSFGAWM